MGNEIIASSHYPEQAMKTAGAIGERRTEERISINVVLIVQELSPSRKTPLARTAVRGVIHNISANGIGITTATPLPYSAVVRCDIALKNLPVFIPTIAQVRWVQRAPAGEYRSGLTYLL